MGRLQRKKSTTRVKKKSNKKLSSDSISVSNVSIKSKKNNLSGIKNNFFISLYKDICSYFRIIDNFFKESKLELKKVVWPSRKQTIASTFVVIIIVCLISIFLGLIDAGLSAIIKSVLR